jgi:hypothetical protein
MPNRSRTVASACLPALLVGAGVALAYLSRENSMVLLPFTAFLAFVAPLLAAVPSALLYRRSRAVFVAIVSPVVAFALAKTSLRLLGFSNERLRTLIIVFAIAIIESSAIAWPVARLHASRRVPARRLPLLGSLYGAAMGGAFAWLALQYPSRLPPNALWFACFCFVSAFAISFLSFVPVRTD